MVPSWCHGAYSSAHLSLLKHLSLVTLSAKCPMRDEIRQKQHSLLLYIMTHRITECVLFASINAPVAISLNIYSIWHSAALLCLGLLHQCSKFLNIFSDIHHYYVRGALLIMTWANKFFFQDIDKLVWYLTAWQTEQSANHVHFVCVCLCVWGCLGVGGGLWVIACINLIVVTTSGSVTLPYCAYLS